MVFFVMGRSPVTLGSRNFMMISRTLPELIVAIEWYHVKLSRARP